MTPIERRSAAAKKSARTRKLMAQARGDGLTCTGCGELRDRNGFARCKSCHATDMRRWRAAQREQVAA